jgi:formylglycine-generating enzyme required for sulfatase activity
VRNDVTYTLDAGDGAIVSGMAIVDGGAFTFSVATSNGEVTAYAALDYQVAIDKTEVTVGAFRQFVEAGTPLPCDGGSCSLDPNGPYHSKMMWDPSWVGEAQSNFYTGTAGSSCQTDNDGGTGAPTITWTAGNPNLPITCVPWQQALAYCAWRGKRLPTDTEYRFFATGQGARSPYPWSGTTLDCQHAVTSACTFPVSVGSTTLGVSKDGVFDLVGSMSEWLWDQCSAGQVYVYPNDAGTDYPGPTGAAGGGLNDRLWINSDFDDNGSAYFQSDVSGATFSDTTVGYDHCGFRCAVTTRYP